MHEGACTHEREEVLSREKYFYKKEGVLVGSGLVAGEEGSGCPLVVQQETLVAVKPLTQRTLDRVLSSCFCSFFFIFS